LSLAKGIEKLRLVVCHREDRLAIGDQSHIGKSLLDNGLSIQRVRRAWDYLRRTGDMDGHLADVRLVTDGQSIFAVAHDETELLDALRQGQLAFFVAIDEIAQDVEDDVTKFELDRTSFREMLKLVEDDVIAEGNEASG